MAGLEIPETDKAQLEHLSLAFIQENLTQYEEQMVLGFGNVDKRRWRLAKTRDDIHVYAERNDIDRYSSASIMRDEVELTAPELPAVLSYGTVTGKLEDLMFGVLSTTAKAMRIKASYVDDLSAGAVLCPIVEPTVEDPLRSLTIKWMELDLPLRQTSFIKNRDYVYMEATGFVKADTGEHVGYLLQHSVEFPQAPQLRNRVRGMFSLCWFFRQVAFDCVEVWASGTVDPGGELMRILVEPAGVAMLLCCTKFAHCGQMKKLTWLMERQYAAKNSRGIKKQGNSCVTCGKTNMIMGKTKCGLCFAYVCYSCKVVKKPSLVTPDDQLVQRKMGFCNVCITRASRQSVVVIARDQIRDVQPLSVFIQGTSSDTMSESSFNGIGGKAALAWTLDSMEC